MISEQGLICADGIYVISLAGEPMKRLQRDREDARSPRTPRTAGIRNRSTSPWTATYSGLRASSPGDQRHSH